MTVARELAMYKLEVVGIQEVKWNKGGIVRARDYILSMEKGTKSSIGNRTFVQNRILTPLKTVQSVSDRMSYIVLRGHWCNIIVLHEHAPTEEKSDDSKDSFMRNYGRCSFS